MDNHAQLKKTPLYDAHIRYGGRVVDFGGWALPVQYSGIIEEHRAVRERVGLFDVSHMGEVTVKGQDALAFLQLVCARDLAPMTDGQIDYTHLLYPNGGTVDDLMVNRVSAEDYLLVINAANTDKDFAWLQEHTAGFSIELANVTSDYAELALQGPQAVATLQKLTSTDVGAIGYYHFATNVAVAGTDCIVSRTGYTGEDGYEILCAPAAADSLWEALLAAGKEFGIIPCGLGARDSLRFEAKMPLYGQELDAETSPLEAGLGRYIDLDKGDFIGRDALLAQKANGLKKKLVGFAMVGRGIPRHGYPISVDGAVVGAVTSGSFSPTLNANIGLGYVPPELAKIGTELQIGIRGNNVSARICKTPFYKRSK
jgi:aminomethyltransferase